MSEQYAQGCGKELFGVFGDTECAGGGRTKLNRTAPGLPKAHHCDALCTDTIPQNGYTDRTHGHYLCAKCIGCGTRYRSKYNGIGITVQKPSKSMHRKRRFGFQNGDIVRAVVPKGRYRGTHTGRVMTRNSGSFAIRTIHGGLAQAGHQYCTRL